MSAPARVLIIHNKYRIPGGEDVCAAAQADLLRSKGHEVHVYEKQNRDIDAFGIFRKARLFFDTTHNSTTAAEVAAIARDFKPASALIHNTLPLISPSVYTPLKRAGVRVIQWLHNYRLVCPAGTLYRDGKSCTLCVDDGLNHAASYRCWTGSLPATLAVNRMLERHRHAKTWHSQVDSFVALNTFMRDLLVSKSIVPAAKTQILPNFASVPLPPRDDAGQGFVFLGRLSDEKGVRVLLEAQKLSRVPLKIIGEGADAYRALGGEGVAFTGPLPREKALEELSHARALVFPSLWQEPFGLSLVEALALARPVVASKVAGPQEIVRDGETGFLLEPGNPAALAERMTQLHGDETLARILGAAARADYQQRFTLEIGYANLLKVMES